jgi:hypothetical protein
MSPPSFAGRRPDAGDQRQSDALDYWLEQEAAEMPEAPAFYDMPEPQDRALGRGWWLLPSVLGGAVIWALLIRWALF